MRELTSPSNDSRPTAVRYIVLAAMCLVAMITYIQRNSLGVVEKEIRSQLQFSKMQSACVFSGLFITYALFQVPGGRLGQIWGCRKALSIYGVICSASTALFAIAGGFPGLLAARMGIGLGQAGVFPCSTDTVKTWIPVHRQALANGAITTSMQVGGILGTQLTGFLASQWGWRITLGWFALPGLLWSAWFYIWYRNRPQEHPAVNDAERQLLRGDRSAAKDDRLDATAAPATTDVNGVTPPDPIPWRQIFRSSSLRWVCAQQFFRGAGYMFYGSWFATFLKEGRGVTELAQAGFMTSAPLAATALGSMAGGWLSDWLLTRTGSRQISRRWLSALSSLAGAVCIVAAYPVTQVWLAVGIISAGAFCAAIAGPIAYTVTIDLGGKHVPTVFGLMNMCGNLGAFAFPLTVPFLVGEGENANWDPVLFLFTGIYLAAAICWTAFDANGTIEEPAAHLIED
ncbi:MAG: MFS transporter [Planctomycetales bacterium]